MTSELSKGLAGGWIGHHGGDNLAGRELRSAYTLDGGHKLHLITDEGAFVYESEGDCCAHAWVESVNAIAELPATIMGVESGNAETEEEGDYGDVLDICFYSIRTTRGHVDVELRISHNGYYGGWLNFLGTKSVPAALVDVAKDSGKSSDWEAAAVAVDRAMQESPSPELEALAEETLRETTKGVVR
jgi:hypothetical protein